MNIRFYLKKYLIEFAYIVFAFVSVFIALAPKGKYDIANAIIYSLFLVEYIVRFYRANDKKTFVINNPFDLIVLLPISSGFRIIRVFRLFKILGINKKFKNIFPKLYYLFNKNELGLLIMWLIFATISISMLLTIYEPQMENFFDALWWAIVTTTTVGYGDIVPVTWFGRIVSIFLMIFGIGIVGVFISNISNIFFMGKSKEDNIFDLKDFEKLDDKARERIKNRIQEEIELELFKSGIYKND